MTAISRFVHENVQVWFDSGTGRFIANDITLDVVATGPTWIAAVEGLRDATIREIRYRCDRVIFQIGKHVNQ